MTQKNDYFADIYQKLNTWLNEVKEEQTPHITEFIKQAKLYANAAESMSEEKLHQFTENIKYDLHDFYQQNSAEVKHSVYLGLLNEALWDTLAKLKYKYPVEWSELVDDFNHDGYYQRGDIMGFGELECQKCNQTIHITHCCELSVCAQCGGKHFIRQPLTP